MGELEQNITRIELENGINAGIRWRSLGADMVPIFEEQSARLELGYTIEQWYSLDRMERAIVIAQRRIDMAAKNHQAEAEINHSKAASKSARRR